MVGYFAISRRKFNYFLFLLFQFPFLISSIRLLLLFSGISFLLSFSFVFSYYVSQLTPDSCCPLAVDLNHEIAFSFFSFRPFAGPRI